MLQRQGKLSPETINLLRGGSKKKGIAFIPAEEIGPDGFVKPPQDPQARLGNESMANKPILLIHVTSGTVIVCRRDQAGRYSAGLKLGPD